MEGPQEVIVTVEYILGEKLIYKGRYQSTNIRKVGHTEGEWPKDTFYHTYMITITLESDTEPQNAI